MKLKKTLPVLLLVVLLGVAGCTSSKSGGSSDKAGAKSSPVTVRLSGDWTNLNPYDTAGNIGTDIIASGVFDRLVALGPDGKTVVPYLATKWTESATDLTFTIRDGVKCSDGSALDAAAAATSLKFMITQPESKLLLGNGPYTVTNDASSVSIKLGSAYSDALYKLTDLHASIVCPAEIPLLKAKNSTTAIGSGPYTITQAVHNDHIALTPNKNWTWGPNGESVKKPGFPSKVTLQVITDESTAANELLSGQLDVAPISGPDVGRLIGNKSLSHSTFGGQYLSPLVFNPTNEALKDLKVRQAISQAIDTKSFMQADTGGYGVTSPSFFASDATCYDPKVASLVPPTDVGAAQKLMESAGYTLSGGKMEKDGKQLALNLLTTTAYFSSASAEYLIAALGKLGIALKVTSLDASGYSGALVKGNFDLLLGLLSGGGPAPGDYILYMTGPNFTAGGANTAYDDPEVDTLVKAAFAATGDQQCPAWAAVQQKVIANRDVLPMDQQIKQFFTRGVTMQTLTMVHLDTLTR
jgi:peptide/nickel transport system substrate-binding protein